jgi:hypothetical protein
MTDKGALGASERVYRRGDSTCHPRNGRIELVDSQGDFARSWRGNGAGGSVGGMAAADVVTAPVEKFTLSNASQAKCADVTSESW